MSASALDLLRAHDPARGLAPLDGALRDVLALESSNEVSGLSVGARGERCASRRRSPQRWPSALALRGHQG